MESLQEQVVALLQQRKAFSQSFYAYSINMQDNSARILALLSLIEQDQASTLYNCKKASQLVALISDQFSDYEQWQWVFILQALCKKKRFAQALFDQLVDQDAPHLHQLAFQFALNINEDLIINAPSKSSELLPLYFTCLFYQNDRKSITTFQFSEAELKQGNSILFQKIFSEIEHDAVNLVEDFIAKKLLDSHLFKLFIVALDEPSVTQVVNRLANDQDNITLIIDVMALSGYSKFIPFICRFMQNEDTAENAYQGLRLLLDDKLDRYLPLSVQLSTDLTQKKLDYKRCSEALLTKWSVELSPILPSRMLAGEAICAEHLNQLWLTGSQAHRQAAALHQVCESPLNGQYYASPECVL